MAIIQSKKLSQPSYEAGSHRGTIDGYIPHRIWNAVQVDNERILSSIRAEDLYANDWGAKSAINSIVTNAVGTGLHPQSVIANKELKLEQEQTTELQNTMEWLWHEWCLECHYRNTMHFEMLQVLAIKSLIRNGEFIHLPVMEERADNKFSLKIQDIKPERLSTPTDKQNEPLLCEGIELNLQGVPKRYWIYSPKPNVVLNPLVRQAKDYQVISANIGHRKGIFHVFMAEYEEQLRGISALSAGIKFFKHFNDAIDYELMAQVIAASFPVFISQEKQEQLPYGVHQDQENTDRYYQNIEPGTILYGNPGERPEILESKRPSQNFINFAELMIRVFSASLGLPYEEVSKDFSKTTYSSARAALLEAWKIYAFYRDFFVKQYCQPFWNMVMEEAYLRGYLRFPKHIDFYRDRHFLCNCRWVGPARGYIDPVKEITANILAIKNNLMSCSESIAERGGDLEEVAHQRKYEKELFTLLGITPEEEQNIKKNSQESEEENE